MGLFDIFKKKGEEPKPVDNSESAFDDALFKELLRYREYVVQFVTMQQRGSYAPVAAYEDNNGEIIGHLYVSADGMYTLSVEEVIALMRKELGERLSNDEIQSYILFYHSQYDGVSDEHPIALTEHEFKAITMSYHFGDHRIGNIALPYAFEGTKLAYAGLKEFSPEQNNYLFTTKLDEHKDYFQDRMPIESEVVENEVGLKISKSNTADNSNTWCGIFGFDSFRNGEANKVLNEHVALSMTKEPTYSAENITINELNYGDVSFKTMAVGGEPKTCIPVVHTHYAIDVFNKEINEWEHVENTEAIITASGRDTFGIKYFATDYAENRETYLTQRNLNIAVSGIAYVLDVYDHEDDEDDDKPKYSEDFTAYMPNEDLANYGCFDFIGQLEDFREVQLLENNSLKAYIMNVRLITNPDVKDFFTIDIYVTPENMRFETLEKGMKITGMFQMQGQIRK